MQGGSFVVCQILKSKEGQKYIGTFPDRFYSVANLLRKIVDQFEKKPDLQLLREFLNCFEQLAEISRTFR